MSLDIQAIRQRASRAEPGPWKVASNEWNLRAAPWRGAVGIEADFDLAVPSLLLWTTRGGAQQENAEFIAAARTDVPALCDELDAARQRIAELKTALKGMTERYCDLIRSEDCGNWDPESEHTVKAARKALQDALRGEQS